MLGNMDTRRLGTVVRAVRVQRRWTQGDVAAAAGLSRAPVSRVERGHAGTLTLDALAGVAGALDIRLALTPSWRGGDLDRLLSRCHAALQEVIARQLAGLPGWEALPEVTFSRYGERGAIDLLAWHRASRSLLVVEVKTELVDVDDVLRAVDRYRRNAPHVARERGWDAASVSVWLAIADTTASRSRVARHASLLRAALPDGSRTRARWLRQPVGVVAAITFVRNEHGWNVCARFRDAPAGIQATLRRGRGCLTHRTRRTRSRDGARRPRALINARTTLLGYPLPSPRTGSAARSCMTMQRSV